MEAQQAQPRGLSMVEERDQDFIRQLNLALSPAMDTASIEQYSRAIKEIIDDMTRYTDNPHERRRLQLEAVIDAITDFVDKTDKTGFNKTRIESILKSAYFKLFITDLCLYLAQKFKTKSEIDVYFENLVIRCEQQIMDDLAAAQAGGPAAEGTVIFSDKQGGKRRSIKKRRKSMSKRRKNMRKSNKKQRRR